MKFLTIDYPPYIVNTHAHLMELPTKILIGDGVISKIGEFIGDENKKKKVVIASGSNVQAMVREVVISSIDGKVTWVTVTAADMQNVSRVMKEARDARCIIGLGGGKSVDVAKLAAFNSNLPFYSVPTSASHDGLSSPFASIKGLDRPYSIKAKPPVGILADVEIISSAPRKLLASGCGDLVSKVTAVRDWQIAHEEKGEYYGSYAANLALMSASVVLDDSKKIARFDKESVRNIVEALISAGVAAGIAGSSRPCSGAEHLFSHYLDLIAPGIGLHGEKCGIGTILVSRLQNIDWQKVRSALSDVGAPTTAREIGLSEDQVIESLLNASSIRPERFTILSKVKLTREYAIELARATGVI